MLEKAEMVRIQKVLKGYSSEAHDCTEAQEHAPDWWDPTWNTGLGPPRPGDTPLTRIIREKQKIEEPEKKPEKFKMGRKNAPWQF